MYNIRQYNEKRKKARKAEAHRAERIRKTEWIWKESGKVRENAYRYAINEGKSEEEAEKEGIQASRDFRARYELEGYDVL